MSDPASIVPIDGHKLVFKGDSGTECEAFIREVRSRAFAQGKQRDNAWMADYASICFDGLALRWFEDLDPEIQENWALLRKALLSQYPHQEQKEESLIPTPAAAPPPNLPPNLGTARRQSGGSDSSSFIPTPAIASELSPLFSGLSVADDNRFKKSNPPLPNSNDLLLEETRSPAFSVTRSEDDYNPSTFIPTPENQPLPDPVQRLPPLQLPAPPPAFKNIASTSVQSRTGRIKLVVNDDGKIKTRYVRRSMNWSSFFKYTAKISDALLVRYTPSSEPHAFEMLNCPTSHEYLGITWDVSSSQKLVLGPGSTMQAEVTAVNGTEPGSVTAASTCSGETRSKIWNVDSEETVTATWIHENGTSYKLEATCMSDWLYLVSDQKAHATANWANYASTRYVFDPV